MDPKDTILTTAREKVGCNGLRHFSDLGKLRQDTLERRFLVAQRSLTKGNMGSVYAMWLRDQIKRIGGAERTKVVKTFCNFLDSWHFDKERTIELWQECIRYTWCDPIWDHDDRMLAQMDAVREEIEREFPALRGSPNTCTLIKEPVLRSKDINRPKALASSRSSQPMQQRKRLKTPTSPSRMKKELFEIDLKRDKWSKTSKVEFVKGTSHREASPSVPGKYTCKRCGVKGHFIQDCPTNSDPSWDSRPPERYVCHICGVRGQHFITSCPKNLSKKESSPRQQISRKQEDNQDECFERHGDQRSKEGRLSPWEENLQQQVLYEAAELRYDQSEVDAHRSANDFLEKLLIDLDDQPAPTQTPDSQRPQDSSSWTPTPPNKRQKILPYKYGPTKSPASAFGLEENQEPDLCGIVDDMFHSFHMDIDQVLSQGSGSPATPMSPSPVEHIEPYSTLKSLARNPPYDEAVLALFRNRRNFWVKTSSRPTALDLWDRKEN